MAGFTPFAVDDPLARQDTEAGGAMGTQRLALAEGLMLSADHFATEQLYHRSRLSRTLAFLHGAGTVAGLDVSYQDVGEDDASLIEIKVSPGLAIDRIGRLIELRFEACLSLRDWMAQTAATADGQNALQQGFRAASGGLPDHVMIDLEAQFGAFAQRPEPAFATGNADQIDGVQPSVNIDSCQLLMLIRDATSTMNALSDMARLEATPVSIDGLRKAKRETLWDEVADAQDGSMRLARLAIPVRDIGDGGLGWDDSFNIFSPTTAPNFDGRLYSYSTAELALLSQIRR